MSLIKKCLLTLSLSSILCGMQTLSQPAPLGEGPWYLESASPAVPFKVTRIASGIENPWGMAFLPSGNILIAEKNGDLRIIRDGELDSAIVSGAPVVATAMLGGLMDVVLHPGFTQNRLVYFSYVKGGENPQGSGYYSTTAVARGRLNESETAISNTEDIFVADAWSSVAGGHGSRLLFAADGKLFMSSPFRRDMERPQDPMSHISKLLRLNDDGTVPADNPFVETEGYLPEIYSIGHRAIEGLTLHPQSGELWASEHGPQGGDEVNIIHAGANYGWPLVSYGRDYDGSRPSRVWLPDMEQPLLYWVPSIATSGMMFYTGDKFPQWQGDLFVGSLMTGRIPGTGHIERIELNASGEQKRELLLGGLKQRIRDVQQGPDGLIYVLTEEQDGALLRLEPIVSE